MKTFSAQIDNHSNLTIAFCFDENPMVQVIWVWIYDPTEVSTHTVYTVRTGESGTIKPLSSEKKLDWIYSQALKDLCKIIISVKTQGDDIPVMRLCLTNKPSSAN